MKVIASELSIRCRGKRYNTWKIYVWEMIVVWPIGATLGIAVLLWRHRSKLNPSIPVDTSAKKKRRRSDTLVDGFQREQRRNKKAMDELLKLQIREQDETIRGLEFLYEDYVSPFLCNQFDDPLGTPMLSFPHL